MDQAKIRNNIKAGANDLYKHFKPYLFAGLSALAIKLMTKASIWLAKQQPADVPEVPTDEKQDSDAPQ